jgi:hypothetical protein
MAKESSTHEEGVPSLEYSPAAADTPFLFSLNRPLSVLQGALLKQFAGRTLTMNSIYEQHHVDTPFIKKNYKAALLKLEENGNIAVTPKNRRKETFADQVEVKFPSGER